MGAPTTNEAVEDVARTSYGRLVAYLASLTTDIAAAEDALSDAFVAALRTWPTRGIPDRPASWMLTAARRSLIGTGRRRDVAERALGSLLVLAEDRAGVPEVEAVPDKRLELLFTCAHPAIAAAVHAPLMLQVVLGLDAARISSAFLIAPSTLGQQLVRAKTKIKDAGIPFAVPTTSELPARTGAVLDAIYAAYGTGWDDPLGHDPKRRGLTSEAIRLASLTCDLLDADAEAHGLAALLLHSDARSEARRDEQGRFVPLGQQDTSQWSRDQIARAEWHLSTALALGRVGPYQLHAAIQSVHNRRAATGRTDWAAVASLYDGLADFSPTIGIQVARAAALLEAEGPAAARRALGGLATADVVSYQPYWTLEAEVLDRESGATAERDRAARKAVELATDPSVQTFLQSRFGVELEPGDGS